MSQKIVVIDDSESARELLGGLLEDEGHEVFLAETGEEGLDMVAEHKPDIVLIDTQMPGIDGFETCQKIKAMEDVDAKVVVITGNVGAVNIAKAKRMGCDGYCVKTAGFVELMDTIKKLE